MQYTQGVYLFQFLYTCLRSLSEVFILYSSVYSSATNRKKYRDNIHV